MPNNLPDQIEPEQEQQTESSLERLKRAARHQAKEKVKQVAKKAVKKAVKHVIKQILIWIGGFIVANLYWIVPLVVVLAGLAVVIAIVAYAYEDPCGAIDMFGEVIGGFTTKVTGVVCDVAGK